MPWPPSKNWSRWADIVDSAQFAKADILDPQGWMMLAFIADPRSGLGRKHKFRISNFDLMKQLPALIPTRSAEEILAMPDFKERVDLYRAENERYRLFVAEQAEIAGQAIVLDFRGMADIPSRQPLHRICALCRAEHLRAHHRYHRCAGGDDLPGPQRHQPLQPGGRRRDLRPLRRRRPHPGRHLPGAPQRRRWTAFWPRFWKISTARPPDPPAPDHRRPVIRRSPERNGWKPSPAGMVCALRSTHSADPCRGRFEAVPDRRRCPVSHGAVTPSTYAAVPQ